MQPVKSVLLIARDPNDYRETGKTFALNRDSNGFWNARVDATELPESRWLAVTLAQVEQAGFAVLKAREAY